MILLLGPTGYIGEAFARELARRGWPHAGVSRKEVDYTRHRDLLQLLRESRASFVINAAGFTGKPNVDACETQRSETLLGNVVLPVTIAQACETAGIPWGHISTGCIYAGAKIRDEGGLRIERDLMQERHRAAVANRAPEIVGFDELDAPNFSFRNPPCSFYSGSKALAEEALRPFERVYLWRLRIPFDEFDYFRNYLSKLQRHPKVYDNVNSLSHRGDFVKACLDLWSARAPFGIYNITNPGYVTAREVVGKIERILKPAQSFEYWADDEEFYRLAARTPRSNCVLDPSKLLATGVKMRPVEAALEDSLRLWQAEGRALPFA